VLSVCWKSGGGARGRSTPWLLVVGETYIKYCMFVMYLFQLPPYFVHGVLEEMKTNILAVNNYSPCKLY